MIGRCECSDPGCPVCSGDCHNNAEYTVYRVDMQDETGTDMCEGCTNDCLDSGVFTTEQGDAQDEDDIDVNPPATITYIPEE